MSIEGVTYPSRSQVWAKPRQKSPPLWVVRCARPPCESLSTAKQLLAVRLGFGLCKSPIMHLCRTDYYKIWTNIVICRTCRFILTWLDFFFYMTGTSFWVDVLHGLDMNKRLTMSTWEVSSFCASLRWQTSESNVVKLMMLFKNQRPFAPITRPMSTQKQRRSRYVLAAISPSGFSWLLWIL